MSRITIERPFYCYRIKQEGLHLSLLYEGLIHKGDPFLYDANVPHLLFNPMTKQFQLLEVQDG